MKETRIALLHCGTLALPGNKLFWQKGKPDLIRMVVLCAVIDHEDGLFLFDTGYDYDFMKRWTPQDKAEAAPDQNVVSQLALLGIEPKDIKLIINSHFHLDHVGGAKHFPDATIVVHEKEYAEVKKPYPFEYQGYSDLSFDPELHKLNFIGDRDFLKRAGTPDEKPPNPNPRKYQLISGDTEVVRGIRLYETPGHSAGQMSMMVEVGGGKKVFFPGDASILPRHFDEMLISGMHVSTTQAYDSLKKMKRIQEENNADLVFAHVPVDDLDYPLAPEWY